MQTENEGWTGDAALPPAVNERHQHTGEVPEGYRPDAARADAEAAAGALGLEITGRLWHRGLLVSYAVGPDSAGPGLLPPRLEVSIDPDEPEPVHLLVGPLEEPHVVVTFARAPSEGDPWTVEVLRTDAPQRWSRLAELLGVE